MNHGREPHQVFVERGPCSVLSNKHAEPFGRCVDGGVSVYTLGPDKLVKVSGSIWAFGPRRTDFQGLDLHGVVCLVEVLEDGNVG